MTWTKSIRVKYTAAACSWWWARRWTRSWNHLVVGGWCRTGWNSTACRALSCDHLYEWFHSLCVYVAGVVCAAPGSAPSRIAGATVACCNASHWFSTNYVQKISQKSYESNLYELKWNVYLPLHSLKSRDELTEQGREAWEICSYLTGDLLNTCNYALKIQSKKCINRTEFLGYLDILLGYNTCLGEKKNEINSKIVFEVFWKNCAIFFQKKHSCTYVLINKLYYENFIFFNLNPQCLSIIIFYWK